MAGSVRGREESGWAVQELRARPWPKGAGVYPMQEEIHKATTLQRSADPFTPGVFEALATVLGLVMCLMFAKLPAEHADIKFHRSVSSSCLDHSLCCVVAVCACTTTMIVLETIRKLPMGIRCLLYRQYPSLRTWDHVPPPPFPPSLDTRLLRQLRGGCSAAFGLAGADGGESLAIVAEVQHAGAGFDGPALAAEIRKVVAAEHGASLAMVRLLRPRWVWLTLKH